MAVTPGADDLMPLHLLSSMFTEYYLRGWNIVSSSASANALLVDFEFETTTRSRLNSGSSAAIQILQRLYRNLRVKQWTIVSNKQQFGILHFSFTFEFRSPLMRLTSEPSGRNGERGADYGNVASLIALFEELKAYNNNGHSDNNSNNDDELSDEPVLSRERVLNDRKSKPQTSRMDGALVKRTAPDISRNYDRAVTNSRETEPKEMFRSISSPTFASEANEVGQKFLYRNNRERHERLLASSSQYGSDQLSNQLPNHLSNQLSNQPASRLPNQLSNQLASRLPTQFADLLSNQLASRLPSSLQSNQLSNQLSSQLPNHLSNQLPSQLSNRLSMSARENVLRMFESTDSEPMRAPSNHVTVLEIGNQPGISGLGQRKMGIQEPFSHQNGNGLDPRRPERMESTEYLQSGSDHDSQSTEEYRSSLSADTPDKLRFKEPIRPHARVRSSMETVDLLCSMCKKPKSDRLQFKACQSCYNLYCIDCYWWCVVRKKARCVQCYYQPTASTTEPDFETDIFTIEQEETRKQSKGSTAGSDGF